LFQSRAELPKIASNDRAKATAEEAAAIVAGSIAYFGTYSVDEGERSLSVTLDGSTFPNILAGSVQKRLITSLDTNELKFANPRTPSGMTLQTVWKRAEVRCSVVPIRLATPSIPAPRAVGLFAEECYLFPLHLWRCPRYSRQLPS